MAGKSSKKARTEKTNWSWCILVAILVLITLIRCRFLDYPLERDEGEYAYAGQLILEGIPPYKLVYNMKLPGTYAFYALMMAFLGQTSAGIHLGLLLVNLCTIVFIFLLARKLLSNLAGLVSAATYGLMSISPDVDGFAAHATHFVVLFAIPGIWLLLKALEAGNLRYFFGSGLLLGLSFLMKQPGAAFSLFALCVFGWAAWKERHLQRSVLLKRGACLGLGMIVPFAITCAVIAAAGLFEKFRFWTFTYASVYGTMLPWRQGVQLLRHYYLERTTVIPVLWLLGALAAVFLVFYRAARPKMVFLFGFGFFSALAVSAGFYFRPHYFVLALPSLALIIGAAVHFGRQHLTKSSRPTLRHAPMLLFAVCWGLAFYAHAELYFQVTPRVAAATLYEGNPFLNAPAVAEQIRQNSAKTDTIAVLGSEPEIYFHAQRRSATGYIYMYPLMELHPYAAQMQQELIREIEQARPKFLVVCTHRYSWLPQRQSNPLVFDWMNAFTAEHYILSAAVSEEDQDMTLDPNRPILDWKNTLLLFELKPNSL